MILLTGLCLAQSVLVVLGKSLLDVPQHCIRIIQGFHCYSCLTFVNCLIDCNHSSMH